MSNFIIDTHKQTTPLDHYWEKCVGSGHAALALRQDWREQLKKCHEELGFEYVRFHGLLDDDISVYAAGANAWEGSPYSFFNVDSIMDFLLEIGMKPFIELSFMPKELASGSQTIFHYQGNVTPPRDYTEWKDLIYNLVKHLVERYGLEEVRSWFFEVWNEPNLECFWAGSQQEYFALYKYAAEAVKQVDSQIPVGGPATASNAWISDLVDYCRVNGVPLDFVSTHHYPTDAALGHGLDMEAQMAQSQRGVTQKMAAQARLEAGELPLYYTEWNNSPSSRDPYHDAPYAAAFAVKSIVDNHGLVDMYSFWTFSDIFEEMPFPSTPFHGGFGLLNLHGIPKPTYRAFEFLHSLGDEKLLVESDQSSTVEMVATRKEEALSLLLYNHNIPFAPIKEETVKVTIKGAANFADITLKRIDEFHGNARRRWEENGSLRYLKKQRVDELIECSRAVDEKVHYTREGDQIIFDLAIPPHGVVAVSIK